MRQAWRLEHACAWSQGARVPCSLEPVFPQNWPRVQCTGRLGSPRASGSASRPLSRPRAALVRVPASGGRGPGLAPPLHSAQEAPGAPSLQPLLPLNPGCATLPGLCSRLMCTLPVAHVCTHLCHSSLLIHMLTPASLSGPRSPSGAPAHLVGCQGGTEPGPWEAGGGAAPASAPCVRLHRRWAWLRLPLALSALASSWGSPRHVSH